MALLAGKTAVITGGSSGIGLATARRFIDEGATVFITGRKPAELETAAAELGPAAVPVQGDVTVPADLHRLRDIAAESGCGLDVVFANAGAAGSAPLGEITDEHFDLLFGTNVKGVVLTVQTLLPLLNDGASIILNSSVAADRGRPGTSVYAATKAAVRSFARSWANELAPRNIRVNTVNPASTDTPMMTAGTGDDYERLTEQLRRTRSEESPMKRLAEADEVAKGVLFLASDLSSFTTGAALPIDGGYNQI
jgi:NAD(P)-dependent dehydrogenase (short-subunit alcohol dehydrogenase family)